jgi:uncharacterized RDD family membrane protein YckC
MQTSPQALESELVAPQKPGHVYHCVCGYQFPIDFQFGGQCPSCQRRISGEAIQNAINATVSISDVKDESRIHHIDLEPDDGLSDKVFGHFRLDRRLGGGGMGAVYRALDMSLQRYVAVKVMQNRNLCSDSRLKAMLREAVAQGRLNHPNVVTIYYVGRQEEEPFLAMELLPGPTLSERLRNDGSIPYEEAIRYGIQVASALKHAALFDIVHADIKPANLIMAGDGRIKLSDFGLSRNRSDLETDGPIAGTPSYVAPELISGAGFSIQSDMYALGVTLFELVFGRTPFELVGNTIRERVSTHLHAVIDFPVPWPSSVPREFKTLIERLLEKTPDARFADYDELLKELNSIAPVSTTPAGYAPRAMAYVADQLVLLLAIAPFAIAIFSLSGGGTTKIGNLQWLVPIIAFASLIVPAIYLLLIYRGWSSVGRYLFQLRIVEEHGLAPRREQLVPREVLRNAFAWCFPLALYVSLQSESLSEFIEFSLIGFMAMNTITLFLLRGRKALHDYLCHSQVVLEVNKD